MSEWRGDAAALPQELTAETVPIGLDDRVRVETSTNRQGRLTITPGPGSLSIMTSSLDSAGVRDHSTGDTARARAYYRDFLPGIVAYLLVLGAVLAWGHLDGTSPTRWAWAMAPVLPAAWIVRAVVRHLHRLDDYQRLLQLQGLGVGFAVAMLSAVTVGFLGIAGLPTMAAGWVVYAAGMAAWLVAAAVTRNR